MCCDDIEHISEPRQLLLVQAAQTEYKPLVLELKRGTRRHKINTIILQHRSGIPLRLQGTFDIPLALKILKIFQFMLYSGNFVLNAMVVMAFPDHLFFLLSFCKLLLLSAFLCGVSISLQMILSPGFYFLLRSDLLSGTSSSLWLRFFTGTRTGRKLFSSLLTC